MEREIDRERERLDTSLCLCCRCGVAGCGRKFTQKCTLTRHLVMHTGTKPYSCQWCDAAFAQSYPLKSHVQKVHSEHMEEFLAQDIRRATNRKQTE